MSAPVLSKRPYKLSPIYHKHLGLGARFVQDEWDWLRAENFKQPEEEEKQAERSVGLGDISHIGKLSLKGNEIMGALREWYSYPHSIKPGIVLASSSGLMSNTLCCVLAKDEAVLLVDLGAKEALNRYAARERQDCLHATDISSVLGGFYLIGPRCREVLSKLTEIDISPEYFPNFATTQAPLAHVQTILLRLDLESLLGYQIYFERAYGEYLWDKIVDAGQEFQLAGIGRLALKLLGWRWS